MRIIVTGREGQIARSLSELATSAGHDLVQIGRPQIDLAGEPKAIVSAISRAQPDIIVSAAAYTAVDKAEDDPDQAFAVNARGAGAVALAASLIGVPLIHLSTDYVFSGRKRDPYVEDDATGPLTVYGASKLAGERATLAAHDNVVILRTAWVFSPFGSNFVKTMLRLAETKDELAVVADQSGNPTSALDAAKAILQVTENLASSPDHDLRGVFHMAGSGEATWADLAAAIFEAGSSCALPLARVRHITTAEFPTRAKRPKNSRLNCAKLAKFHGVGMPDWRSSLKVVVDRIAEEQTHSEGGL